MNKEDINVVEYAKKIKKYCEAKNCEKCPFCCGYGCKLNYTPNKWNLSQKQILDKVEKDYLWNIIKPFKERVEYVVKLINWREKEFIAIYIKDNCTIYLPCFSENSMYKNMKIDKKYTVKELFGDDK